MPKSRGIGPYILREWPILALILGLTAAGAALAALQPWPLKLLVDCALGDGRLPAVVSQALKVASLPTSGLALIGVAAVASLIVFALNSSVDVVLTWAWARGGQRMVYRLAADLLQRLHRLSLLFHRRSQVGDLLDRLSTDTYCVYTVAESLLVSPGRNLLTLTAVTSVAWGLSPRLALVSLAAAPVLAGMALLFGGRLTRRSQTRRRAEARLLSFVHQTLTAMPVVQAFGSEVRNRRTFDGLAADAVTFSQRETFLSNACESMTGLATAIGAAAVLLLGGQDVAAGRMSVGSLLVFVAYLRSMQGAFRGLLSTYGALKRAEASIGRVREVLESDDEVREAPSARPLPSPPSGERGHVRIEAVTFGYEPGRPVLRDVSLEARPGETVAIVGPTGAGKSTLVSLVPRLLDPWEGRVWLDGLDVRGLQIRSARDQVALVLQEPFLLPLTVADNIAYARPDATRSEIVAAAQAANADEFVRKLPEGYDTLLGEQGATLSGGERQRLSIARAFLKDAPILVLDEPTSALDARTEAALLDALQRLMHGRTTLIIAHRLSTIRHADRIIVLDGGRVAETGTEEELLAAGGLYSRLRRRGPAVGGAVE
jgi:ATP-binding cassette subfamily B protein/subfamily B ATP-binding cassette protein MsbA